MYNIISIDDKNKIIIGWEDCVKNDNLLRGIYAYGFENPSPIQAKAIYPMTCKRDVIAQAQSGTGKTATFSIGFLIAAIFSIASCNSLLVLIMPTRLWVISCSSW